MKAQSEALMLKHCSLMGLIKSFAEVFEKGAVRGADVVGVSADGVDQRHDRRCTTAAVAGPVLG